MGVFQRKDRGGVWTYRFTLDGEEYKGKCLLPTGQAVTEEHEARDAEQRVKERVLRERAIKTAPPPGAQQKAFKGSQRMTLAQAFSKHLTQVQSEKRSAMHLACLARHSKEALDFFGWDTAVADCGSMVDEFRARVVTRPRRIYIGGQRKLTPADYADPSLWKMLDRPRSPSEQNHVLNALRSAFKAAYETRDSITGEPQLPYPPLVRPVPVLKREPTPMRANELAARYKVAPPWVKDAIDLARQFGLRLSEVLGVTVDMVEYHEQGLLLPAAFVKGKSDQFAEGGDEGWELLKRLVRQARTRHTNYLVTWPGLAGWKALERGEPIAHDTKWKKLGSINRAFKQTAVAAGIARPRRFHDLRAAYITEASTAGSVFEVKKVARHQSITTTERYVNLDRSVVQAVVRRARRKTGVRV